MLRGMSLVVVSPDERTSFRKVPRSNGNPPSGCEDPDNTRPEGLRKVERRGGSDTDKGRFGSTSVKGPVRSKEGGDTTVVRIERRGTRDQCARRRDLGSAVPRRGDPRTPRPEGTSDVTVSGQ